MLKTTCTWIGTRNVLPWMLHHLLLLSYHTLVFRFSFRFLILFLLHPNLSFWLSGPKRLFICSGTVVNSYDAANGQFFATILTSATLLRCPTTQDTVPEDIKVSYSYVGACYFIKLTLYILHVKTNVVWIHHLLDLCLYQICEDPNPINRFGSGSGPRCHPYLKRPSS